MHKNTLSSSKPYLFLDFDFTCTYIGEGKKIYVKQNLNEFLKFCTNKFTVIWTSTSSKEHIYLICKNCVDVELLDKIEYEEIQGNSKVEFIYYKIEDNNNFIYIDDDITAVDYELLKDAGLLNNFIMASKYDKDELLVIEDKLEQILQQRF